MSMWCNNSLIKDHHIPTNSSVFCARSKHNSSLHQLATIFETSDLKIKPFIGSNLLL